MSGWDNEDRSWWPKSEHPGESWTPGHATRGPESPVEGTRAGSKGKRPAWLPKLVPGSTGRPLGNPDHLVTLPLAKDECRACKQTVLRCHVWGWPWTLGPQNLTLEQEVLAVAAGLQTFFTVSWSQRVYALPREPKHIAKDVTDGRPFPVLTKHLCPGRLA